MRAYRSSVLLVLFGFLISLLLAEGLARIFIPRNAINRYIFDARLGHARPRNLSGTYATGEFFTQLHFNSLGVRDSEHDLRKAPNILRIAVLGDSYIEGAQVSSQELLTSKLQSILSESPECRIAHKNVEVMNFGVSGYGTTQEMEFFDSRVKAFEPDLVLLGFLSGNDIKNNSIILDQGTKDYRLAIRPYFDLNAAPPVLRLPPPESEAIISRSKLSYRLLDSSRLLTFVYGRLTKTPFIARMLEKIGLLSTGNLGALSELPTDYFVYNSRLTPEWEEAWNATILALSRIQAATAAIDARFLVFAIPNREQVVAGVWARILETYPAMKDSKYSWDLEFPNQKLIDASKRTNLNLFDLLPKFREHQRPFELYFENDGHFTGAGHAAAAQALAEYLLQRRLACAS